MSTFSRGSTCCCATARRMAGITARACTLPSRSARREAPDKSDSHYWISCCVRRPPSGDAFLTEGTAHISPRADSLLAGCFEAISTYITPDLAYIVEVELLKVQGG